MLIDGIHVPLTVPFYRNGESYLRKLEHNVGRYSLTPAAGLVALAPGGEGAALCDDEIRDTLQAVGASAAAEKVLIAGVEKDSVNSALRVARSAEDAGFDVLLLAAPPQWRSLRADTELPLFFRAVADGSPLPVMLWSAVSPEFVFSVEMLAELAAHRNILGMYDAGLSLDRYRAIAAATKELQRDTVVTPVFAPVTRRMMRPVQSAGSATFVTAESLAGGAALATAAPATVVKTRTRKVGFQVMAAGGAQSRVELWEAGVAGAMPHLAACAPQGCYEAYAAFKDGDPALAREKELRLSAADALMAELGIPGVKYGCDWNGYYGGIPRLPRVALGASDRARVEAVLAGLRN